MKKEDIQKLQGLYSMASKHYGYQTLPSQIKDYIKIDNLVRIPRYENIRLNFMLEHLSVNDKLIADIGGNTGFFTFEFIKSGAKFIEYFESNERHVNFVEHLAKVTNLSNKININNMFIFKEIEASTMDITLNLNVLHHVGDDFDSSVLSISEAKNKILEYLNSLSIYTKILVFQLGFNWKGNPVLPLFESGTKEELIRYVKSGIKDHWKIRHLGIPERVNEDIVYGIPSQENLSRNDEMGEFLNRPIFILEAI